MSNKPRKSPLRRKPPSLKRQTPWPQSRRAVRLFLIGLVAIGVGYFCLSRPPVNGFLSLTVAPVLLVAGYVILIPLALLHGAESSSDTSD